MPVRPGQKFVIIDAATGDWINEPTIYDSSREADDEHAKIRRHHPRSQVIDAVWYKPAEAKLRALGMRAASGDRINYLESLLKTGARNDPYWMVARYPGKDKNGKPFRKGDRVFYYPLTKTFLTGSEAEAASRDFDAHAFDEDFGMRSAAKWTEAEALDVFDRWYKRDGHWIYSSREKALHTWKTRGIDGLPEWSKVVKEASDGARFLAKKYGLTTPEAQALAANPRLVDAVEEFRERNGLPHPASALVRGKIWELIGFERAPRKTACGEGPCQCGGACGCGGGQGLPLSLQPDYGKSDAALPRVAALVDRYLQASNQVAETILRQMGGTRRLMMMTGAKNFVSFKGESESPYGSGLGGVSFQFPKGKVVRITLDPSDTYTVEFGTTRGYNKKFKGIYAGQLQDLFERETGLYLKLGSRSELKEWWSTVS